MSSNAITYSKALDTLATGGFNFASDTFMAAILASYTIGTTEIDAQFVADIITGGVATEATGDVYVAGGLALASVAWTQDPSGVWYLTADDVEWDGDTTLAGDFALFYKDTGDPATSPLLGYWDFGGTRGPTGGDPFVLALNALGLLSLTPINS